jgi:hypothetical protein
MDNTKPKNLIHPNLVKKSYLYLGTPPLIVAKNIKEEPNLRVKKKV